MKKIDMHHHLPENNADYVEKLLTEMDRFEVEKCGLIGGTRTKNNRVAPPDNKLVREICRAHSERLFGIGMIRLGVDSSEMVDMLAEMDFKMLKFIAPRKAYSEDEYLPIYEKAEKYGLPCLFHTGIVSLRNVTEKVCSFNADPIHLEPLSVMFPRLKIIIAHLGIQSYMTAVTLIRLKPNVYADLSGSVPGWRRHFDASDWNKIFRWEGSYKKILYGSDVHYSEFAPCMEIYQNIMESAGWNTEDQEYAYYKNAELLLKNNTVLTEYTQSA